MSVGVVRKYMNKSIGIQQQSLKNGFWDERMLTVEENDFVRLIVSNNHLSRLSYLMRIKSF